MQFSLLFTALTALWVLSGWLRIYRYARYFQLEGYNSQRFARWLLRADRPYLIGSLLSLLAVVGIGLVLQNQSSDQLPFLLIGLNLILIALNLVIRPFDRQIKQSFTPTPRARRLLITAYVVDALLGGIVIIRILAALPDFSAMLWSGIVGAMAVVLVPWTLPIANAVMFPVEEMTRRYYLRLARRNLERSGATVIAITGSYGKTSTKYYLNHILNAQFRVLMTPKSYNTLLGISRVINDTLARDASYEYFIVETDAYFVGENAQICRLVKPQISLVMTVGPMHLERLGSMENIAKAQYEVIEALPPTGLGIFNADDPKIREMEERGYPQNRIVITRQGLPDARIAALDVQMRDDGLHFTVRDKQTNEECAMYAPLYGEHNVTNILMATAVAHHLGMSLADITGRVATLQPAEHRLNRRVLADGTVLIDDAYSANPVGTAMALQVLGLQPGTRRVVISSGMFELGPLHIQENHKLGERMADVATDVILVGATQTIPVQEGLSDRHFPKEHLHVVNTLDEAIQAYRAILQPGDALLMLTDLPDTYA